MRLSLKHIVSSKVLLHLAALLPLLWLVYAVSTGAFSAVPVKDVQHFTGRMALKLLLALLLVTPLARYARQPLLIRCRRLLGLWCFAWATLHLASYALLELGIDNLRLLSHELMTRPLSDSRYDQLDHFAVADLYLYPLGAAQVKKSLANFA